MKCPNCGGTKSAVIDSRSDIEAIRRRRECQNCKQRFTTYERIEHILPMIIKKDKRREQFNINKLKKGILIAFQKRPVSMDIIDQVVKAIIKKVQQLNDKEISSQLLGEFVMNQIKPIDKIAYIRFASVYREFSDVSQFKDALAALEKD